MWWVRGSSCSGVHWISLFLTWELSVIRNTWKWNICELPSTCGNYTEQLNLNSSLCIRHPMEYIKICFLQYEFRSTNFLGVQNTKKRRFFQPWVLHQADRTFRMRLTSDVAVAILSTLCCTTAHRFSIGDKSGLLSGLTPFAQKTKMLNWHHFWVLVALWAGVPSCWKTACDMSGKRLIADGGPFFFRRLIADAAVSFITSWI